jgi:hypothetical protein
VCLWRRILGRLVRQRQPAALGTTLRQNASRAGAFRATGAVPCVPSNQESPSRGDLGLSWSPLIRAIKLAVRMPSRNQSFCSQLWFCRGRSWGGRHGQADQRVAAADLHGRVYRERHIRRNAAPLSRRANLVRAGASFDGIAFAVQAARPFWGASGKAAAGNGPAVCRFRPHRRPQPVDHDAVLAGSGHRHFSLPQFSSASRRTAGASSFLVPSGNSSAS